MEIDITEHLKLVHYVMKVYRIKPIGFFDEDDYFQAGCIGLWIAAQKYTKSHGTTFSTYAVPWIRSEIYKLKHYERAQKRTAQTVSLHKVIHKKGYMPIMLIDIIPDEQNSEERLVESIDLDNRLSKAMKIEPFIIQKIIEGYKTPEIGKQMGITHQRVSQRLKALRNKVKV